MRLETSNDFIFSFQAGVLSILRLVVTRTDGLPGGLTGGVDEVVARTDGLPGSLTGGVDKVKGGSLIELNRADVEGT